MVPLPKRRWSTRRQGKKRATQTLKKPVFIYCPNCQNPVLPHTACSNCGWYKNRQIVTNKEKKKTKK